MLTSIANTVVLNKYARMQWIEPMPRIGFEVNESSAICPDVPMTLGGPS
jgi:hypothetical protein